MSFTGQIKQEIGRQIPGAAHCRKAFLAALLSFCGTLEIAEDEHVALVLETEQEQVCTTFLQLVRKTFRIPSEQLHFARQVRAKTSLYRIRLEEEASVQTILRALGFLNAQGELQEEQTLFERALLERDCCKRSFLRGAFLAAGHASDPNRSYHFEIRCAEWEDAKRLAAWISELGIPASVAQRRNHYPVYLKDGSAIADMLGMLEARVAMMDFENARILREVRGNVNRKVNCEAANIKKTATSAAEQIREIRRIEENVGLSELPPALDEMARIRLQYPSATLQELGEKMEPPIGKSGVNHRLRKISAFARQLQAGQGGKQKDAE